VARRDLSTWVEKFKKLDAVEKERVVQKDLFPTKKRITPGEVIRRINARTGEEAIVVTDVGQHQMFASRYCRHKQTRSFVTSGGLGTMGFGLPAAIGAKIGAPDRTVVCMVGDGGIQMTIQELGTIMQTGAAVKIVLFNNRYLGMVRQWQELFFDKQYSETYLENPDFVKVCEGYGIKGSKVESREALDDAIFEMLDTDGAYLLEVTIEKEENVFPMVPAGASVSDIMLEPPKK
jgi:acetolactate synthase-1/2/3 large subunit